MRFRLAALFASMFALALLTSGCEIDGTSVSRTTADPDACLIMYTDALSDALMAATDQADLDNRMANWLGDPPTECQGLSENQQVAIVKEARGDLSDLIRERRAEWAER